MSVECKCGRHWYCYAVNTAAGAWIALTVRTKTSTTTLWAQSMERQVKELNSIFNNARPASYG